MAKHKGSQMDNNDYIDSLRKVTANYKKFADLLFEISNQNTSNNAWHDMYLAYIDATANIYKDPERLKKDQAELIASYMKIWTNACARYLGEQKQPLYGSDSKDRRFKDQTWNNDLVFDFIKQSYLFTQEWTKNYITNLPNIDTNTKNKIEFYTRQILDAASPSNFAMTNPEVIRETIKTGGENLIKGFNNLANDIENSKSFLNIKTTNPDAFKLGENIATAKGSVIYRNDLMELIQYSPTTKKTYENPLLIIPAWINKYYILDLSPENSFVKWAVDAGYTVFMISWVNPTPELSHKKFEDYMFEGPLSALDAIEKATGKKKITACGYCLGGTLLSCTMAYMKAQGDNRIVAATLLTTMIDFSNSGDLCLFMDEDHLQQIDQQMQQNGVLEGDQMAAIFSILRANDLIWSFVINNYLLGREPFPFDILYWNSDTTRLPAETHSFYLRNMYLKNALAKKNGIKLKNCKIDVGLIDVPIYALSTLEDHIAPWRTTYKTCNLVKSSVEFVLCASGHIAGVINPPHKNKYHYFTNSKKYKDSDKWLKNAEKNTGSWWNHWDKWLSKLSGKKINAPKIAKPIEDAPGSYVKII